MKGQPGTLWVDVFEPDEILRAIQPVIPAAKAPINTWGKADYYWVDSKGYERMYSRKQLPEILGDLDAAEEQLQRHLSECDELALIVEGVGLPTVEGMRYYTLEKSGRMRAWHNSFTSPGHLRQLSRYEALKWVLWHDCGVYVAEVCHWSETARHLCAAFTQSQKPEHHTLQRYVVPHVPPFDANPHVDNLCRLRGLKIGPETAQKLINKFNTVYGVMTAKYSELVALMGGPWTEEFMKGIGRE